MKAFLKNEECRHTEIAAWKPVAFLLNVYWHIVLWRKEIITDTNTHAFVLSQIQSFSGNDSSLTTAANSIFVVVYIKPNNID